MRQNHRHRRKRLSGTAIAAVLVCTALLYAGVLLGIRTVGNRLEKSDVPEPVGSLDGRFASDKLTLRYANRTWVYRKRDLTNILLMGVDWAEMNSPASSGRYAGQADFLLLVTFDKKNKIVSMLQIDRDTMTDVRVYSPFGDYTGVRETQLCLSHAYGATAEENCENTVWAVGRLLGNIPIDGYMALDMSGITALNDALGGVTVTLEEDFSALDPEMAKGATLTLRGKQAETFVRGRMDVGDGANASRMRRQRTYMTAFMKKAQELVAEDSGMANTLYKTLTPYMVTDLSGKDVSTLLETSRSYTFQGVMSPEGTVNSEGKLVEFYVDEASLRSLVLSLYYEAQ